MASTTLRSIVLASAFAAVAVAAPVANESPIEGYAIVPATWELDGPDGQVIQLNGTVQEVVAQLDVIVPNSRNKLIADIATASASAAEASTLERRYDEESLHCFVSPWGNGYVDSIQDGINYLNNVPGRPWHNPGPGNCARVSCSYRSAIYWCNDNRFRKELNSFKDIAHGADRIKNTCRRQDGVGSLVTNGQIFYTDGWNVIVRSDSC
ncbi:uncharacterized protein B0H64DRAFT_474703 [Chaetomium fimeti]|uniref:Secreted protein n=1 Tax=Chaetomium fimeti TaxID=1854472 RepID=A0AAE0HGB8_9PEZI|nr:hypothetical protein B0H64DRAFT_474703 [Chaetomium fimeti]